MDRATALIRFDSLERKANQASWEFRYPPGKRWIFRARWLMVSAMTAQDVRQKDIAELLDIHYSTVYYYQNKYKPAPGEWGLLKKLMKEIEDGET